MIVMQFTCWEEGLIMNEVFVSSALRSRCHLLPVCFHFCLHHVPFGSVSCCTFVQTAHSFTVVFDLHLCTACLVLVLISVCFCLSVQLEKKVEIEQKVIEKVQEEQKSLATENEKEQQELKEKEMLLKKLLLRQKAERENKQQVSVTLLHDRNHVLLVFEEPYCSRFCTIAVNRAECNLSLFFVLCVLGMLVSRLQSLFCTMRHGHLFYFTVITLNAHVSSHGIRKSFFSQGRILCVIRCTLSLFLSLSAVVLPRAFHHHQLSTRLFCLSRYLRPFAEGQSRTPHSSTHYLILYSKQTLFPLFSFSLPCSFFAPHSLHAHIS